MANPPASLFSSPESPGNVSTQTDPLTVQVYLDSRSYEIQIVSDSLSRTAELMEPWVEQLPGRAASPCALIVTDSNVRAPWASSVEHSLKAAGWKIAVAEVEPGETSKSLNVVAGLYDRMVELEADRRTMVIAVGGGVVGDLAGFVAATWARGVPFIQIPTTLLAHVDSSVGGKVGVNHAAGKNLIGAFHQPLGVLIDTATLASLPPREFSAGLAEVIKYGVILDADFFAFLEQQMPAILNREPAVLRQIIARCCRLKADVVEQDEFERTGLRAVLNYGHTFAHAFEALAGYGVLLHGEAVALGMVCASRLAERLGRIDADLTRRQVQLMEQASLPVALTASTSFPTSDVLDRMRLDKKTLAGKLRFVLPSRLGHVELVDDVPEDLVRGVLDDMATSSD